MILDTVNLKEAKVLLEQLIRTQFANSRSPSALGNAPTPAKPTDIDKDGLSQADDYMLKDIGASSAPGPLSICSLIPAPVRGAIKIMHGPFSAIQLRMYLLKLFGVAETI